MSEPRFTMTPGGRIMLTSDYKREQQSIQDWQRYQQREQLNREYKAAQRAAIAERVNETGEPELCSCGQHYVSPGFSHDDWAQL